MTGAEPILMGAALTGIGGITVASFVKIWALDKKFGELMVRLTDDDVGLFARVGRLEKGQKRHSDALRASGFLSGE